MLHGYCIRRAGEAGPPKGLTGVDGAGVELIENEVLGMWVSPTTGEGPSPERLRAHEQVVRQALRSATPLPLRYGSTLRGPAEAEALLQARREQFLITLERLADRVEMGLWVAHREGHPSPGGRRSAPRTGAQGPGRAYLEARKNALETEAAERVQAELLLDQIEAELADLGLPAARTIVDRGDLVGSLAHLLHREEVPRYRKRASRLQVGRPDLRISITGPWAPYSFV